MTRTGTVFAAALLFFSAAGCATTNQTVNTRASRKPNVLLILADDIGIEGFGVYGGTSYRTPNIDRLAQTGIRFDRAYALPLCAPSRLQLMTGKYVFRNWEAFGIINPKERTFAHWMKTAGYKTALVGKWQLYSYDPPDRPTWRGKGTRPEDSGFDEHFVWHGGHTEDKGSRYADPTILDNGRLRKEIKGAYGEDLFADYVIDFMRRHRNQPFFAYYPMVLPHNPFVPTPDSEDWRDPHKRHVENKQYPDSAMAMGMNAGRTKYFPDMVAYMDKVVGRVVAALDELGLRDNTLVVFTSDNGTHLSIVSQQNGRSVRGGKELTLDTGIHVPLIANWPGVIAPGRVSDDIIDTTDHVPTFLEVAGTTMPPGTDGRSFLPQLRGEKGNPRPWAFFHYDPRPGIDKDRFKLERFVLDKRFKLYEDGRLYDMTVDAAEQQPILAGQGGPEAEAARARLRPVLDQLRPTNRDFRVHSRTPE